MISERKGDHRAAVKLMNRIRARFGSAANYQYAQFAAQSGDLEGGIAALDAAWKERDPGR